MLPPQVAARAPSPHGSIDPVTVENVDSGKIVFLESGSCTVRLSIVIIDEAVRVSAKAW